MIRILGLNKFGKSYVMHKWHFLVMKLTSQVPEFWISIIVQTINLLFSNISKVPYLLWVSNAVLWLHKFFHLLQLYHAKVRKKLFFVLYAVVSLWLLITSVNQKLKLAPKVTKTQIWTIITRRILYTHRIRPVKKKI